MDLLVSKDVNGVDEQIGVLQGVTEDNLTDKLQDVLADEFCCSLRNRVLGNLSFEDTLKEVNKGKSVSFEIVRGEHDLTEYITLQETWIY